jgi:hypothetical protein
MVGGPIEAVAALAIGVIDLGRNETAPQLVTLLGLFKVRPVMGQLQVPTP